jgi:predicted DCC family thiol-disulfide oxidoreductase YuxK
MLAMDVMQQKILLYDGICKLCNGWLQFVIKRDPDIQIKLASIQSSIGKKLLQDFGYDVNELSTMVYIEEEQCWDKSDAFFKVIRQLKTPLKYWVIFKLVPKVIRNWVYDKIASNRYRLFGKYQSCPLITENDKAHHLNDDVL